MRNFRHCKVNVVHKQVRHTSKCANPTTHHAYEPIILLFTAMQSINQFNIEGRVSFAINALKTGQISSFCAAARLYEIPKDTLRRRYYGTLSRRDTR